MLAQSIRSSKLPLFSKLMLTMILSAKLACFNTYWSFSFFKFEGINFDMSSSNFRLDATQSKTTIKTIPNAKKWVLLFPIDLYKFQNRLYISVFFI